MQPFSLVWPHLPEVQSEGIVLDSILVLAFLSDSNDVMNPGPGSVFEIHVSASNFVTRAPESTESWNLSVFRTGLGTALCLLCS